MSEAHSQMRLIRAGINTHQQPVVSMHRDCHVCRSEGFNALTRVLISSLLPWPATNSSGMLRHRGDHRLSAGCIPTTRNRQKGKTP